MAGFHTKTFIKHDDYETPKSAWENIKDYIPTDKVIWESFYCGGSSGSHLQELGFDVIHEDIDFFKEDRGDIIVTNPPFTKKKQVFTRLKELGKPFIVICPSSMINTKYIRELFSDAAVPLQIIIPRKRIHFIKKVAGETPKDWKSSCNFDCFYYVWKVGLDRDITWLSS
jgi:hypothetical protein